MTAAMDRADKQTVLYYSLHFKMGAEYVPAHGQSVYLF